MPLNEIKKEIEQESKKQTKSIHDEAQKEKERILDDAEQRAKQITKTNEDETKQELDRLALENSASAELAAREIELVARESALDSEIGSTINELMKAIKNSKGLYKKIFSDAIKTASEVAPMREFRIIVNKHDSDLVGKTDAHMEYQNLTGGLIIESLDKSIRVDATLESIVDSKRNEIKSAILERMFGSDLKPKRERRVSSKKVRVKKVAKHNKKISKPKKKTNAKKK